MTVKWWHVVAICMRTIDGNSLPCKVWRRVLNIYTIEHPIRISTYKQKPFQLIIQLSISSYLDSINYLYILSCSMDESLFTLTERLSAWCLSSQTDRHDLSDNKKLFKLIRRSFHFPCCLEGSHTWCSHWKYCFHTSYL